MTLAFTGCGSGRKKTAREKQRATSANSSRQRFQEFQSQLDESGHCTTQQICRKSDWQNKVIPIVSHYRDFNYGKRKPRQETSTPCSIRNTRQSPHFSSKKTARIRQRSASANSSCRRFQEFQKQLNESERCMTQQICEKSDCENRVIPSVSHYRDFNYGKRKPRQETPTPCPIRNRRQSPNISSQADKAGSVNSDSKTEPLDSDSDEKTEQAAFDDTISTASDEQTDDGRDVSRTMQRSKSENAIETAPKTDNTLFTWKKMTKCSQEREAAHRDRERHYREAPGRVRDAWIKRNNEAGKGSDGVSFMCSAADREIRRKVEQLHQQSLSQARRWYPSLKHHPIDDDLYDHSEPWLKRRLKSHPPDEHVPAPDERIAVELLHSGKPSYDLPMEAPHFHITDYRPMLNRQVPRFPDYYKENPSTVCYNNSKKPLQVYYDFQIHPEWQQPWHKQYPHGKSPNNTHISRRSLNIV